MIATMSSIPGIRCGFEDAVCGERGGTKTMEVLAPVASTAAATLSEDRHPSTSVPPLPGVTPATRFVPEARLRRAIAPLRSGETLDEETSGFVHVDRHQWGPR